MQGGRQTWLYGAAAVSPASPAEEAWHASKSGQEQIPDTAGAAHCPTSEHPLSMSVIHAQCPASVQPSTYRPEHCT